MAGLGVTVRGLTVRYGSTVALDGIDLDIRPFAAFIGERVRRAMEQEALRTPGGYSTRT